MAKILVVDDEEDIRIFLKLHLEDNGHKIQCARNGSEGFELLKTFKPNLAILDIIMPQQSGIKLFNEMRKNKEFKSIPIIILSAIVRHREQFKEQYGSIPPPDAFVDKSFEPEKLIKLIDSLLKHK